MSLDEEYFPLYESPLWSQVRPSLSKVARAMGNKTFLGTSAREWSIGEVSKTKWNRIVSDTDIGMCAIQLKLFPVIEMWGFVLNFCSQRYMICQCGRYSWSSQTICRLNFPWHGHCKGDSHPPRRYYKHVSSQTCVPWSGRYFLVRQIFTRCLSGSIPLQFFKMNQKPPKWRYNCEVGKMPFRFYEFAERVAKLYEDILYYCRWKRLNSRWIARIIFRYMRSVLKQLSYDNQNATDCGNSFYIKFCCTYLFKTCRKS